MAPTYFGDADVQLMLDTFGVPVVVGVVTARGVVDLVDEEMLRSTFPALQGKTCVVRVRTNTFAGLLLPKAAITVEGIAYKIHAALQEGDGALTVVTCVKVQ